MSRRVAPAHESLSRAQRRSHVGASPFVNGTSRVASRGLRYALSAGINLARSRLEGDLSPLSAEVGASSGTTTIVPSLAISTRIDAHTSHLNGFGCPRDVVFLETAGDRASKSSQFQGNRQFRPEVTVVGTNKVNCRQGLLENEMLRRRSYARFRSTPCFPDSFVQQTGYGSKRCHPAFR